MKKVVFCIPTVSRPYQVCLDSLKASVPVINAAGWEDASTYEIGNPYISAARMAMLRRAIETNADAVVFIDHDLSWRPEDMLSLLDAEGDVVAGTYRFKREPEEYMGALLPGIDGTPQVRSDGCILAHCIPAGFLRITRAGINKFMYHYPKLQYLEQGTLCVDLFNHGVHEGVWYGEDYAFSRNWNEKCGQIWIDPRLRINHHTADAMYPGDFHSYLLRQPGGSDDHS